MQRPIRTANAYHWETSYRRGRLTPHQLDWQNQPVAVKRYPALPRIPLKEDAAPPDVDFFTMHSSSGGQRSGSGRLDLGIISRLLRLSHAVTGRIFQGTQPFFLRSVASAGALYPFELYLAAHRIDGLQAGVYYYDLFGFALSRLREGVTTPLPAASRRIAATLYVTGIFFRSAWKYRSRAYRYVLLDAGHLIENVRLALKALGLSFCIELDFDDDQAARLLGVDPHREGCLAAVHLFDPTGQGEMPSSADTEKMAALEPLEQALLQASAVSGREVVYKPILALHQAGRDVSKKDPARAPLPGVLGRNKVGWVLVDPPDHPAKAAYAQVLQKRRSRRNFRLPAHPKDAFQQFVHQLFRHMAAGSDMPAACRSLVSVGLLVGEKMPVEAGYYVLDPTNERLGRLMSGHFIAPMATACLDQLWLRQSALHLLFLTDLIALDQNWGARGYRYAMMEAGRLGQQAYLTATALGWGACGIGALYDREAASLLALSDREALLYLVGVGPIRTRRRSA